MSAAMKIKVKIGDIARPIGLRATSECALPVYSVTKHDGMVPSSEYFKKQVYSRDIEGYKVVARGQFAYATIHLDEGSIGVLDTADACVISPMYTVFEVDKSRVHAPYLLRLLKSPRALKEYTLLGNGSVHRRRSIPFEALARLEVSLPSISEQQRDSKILEKADSLRSKRQEAIHLAHDFLRAVFIDMFGGLDIASNPTVRLADVVALDAPMVDPTHEDFADLLHVGPDRIEKGNGQLMECETARAEGLISKKFLFDERYVLYSKIRPTLKKCALAEFRGLCSADMYPVRPSRDDMTREFIWGLLLSDVFDRYVSTLADRANIPKLNRVELNAFEFRLPPVELQRKYSAIVRRTMNMKRRHNTFLQQANSLPAALGFFD